MNCKKVLSIIFGVFAIVLSVVMCIVVACNCRLMLWGIKYEGWSAPSYTAFLYAIPFAVAIFVCAVLSAVLHRKGSRQLIQSKNKEE